MMDFKIVFVVALVSIVLCVGLGTVAGQVVDVEESRTQVELMEAETGLVVAETERETLTAFREIVEALLGELRREREFQRGTLQEIMGLFGQLAGLMGLAIVGNLALSGVLVLAIVVVAVALWRRERSGVVMLPRRGTGLLMGEGCLVEGWTEGEEQEVVVYRDGMGSG